MELRPHLTYANVMVTLIGFAVLGGGAVAIGGAGGDQGEIRACYDKKGATRGDVRLLIKGKCKRRTEKLIVWSQEGPQGAPGEQGPPGPTTGPAGGDLSGNYPDPQIASGALAAQELACEGNGGGDEMVRAGTVCIDKYEASVWTSLTGGAQLVTEAQIDAACPNTGQSCKGKIFARSVPGVEPAHDITFFQTLQALANSGKRLPTNAEWQTAVAGTPDTGGSDSGPPSCNTDSTFVPAATGSRANCVSSWGAIDMVGNVAEWVDAWDEQAEPCTNYPAEFGGDRSCFGEDPTPSRFPGVLTRGGDYDEAAGAGPFEAVAFQTPQSSASDVGFRGAR